MLHFFSMFIGFYVLTTIKKQAVYMIEKKSCITNTLQN